MTEFIDILDDSGKSLGHSKPRSEVHKSGLWHKTVHVWLVNSNNMLLLQQLCHDKEIYPDMWGISAAGHIPAGVTSEAAALKELHEELAVQAQPDDLQLIGTVKNPRILNDGEFIDNEYNDVFVIVKDIDIKDLKFDSSETQALKYFTVDELKAELAKSDSKIINHAEEFKILFKYLEE